jgi:hypothetical protein
MSSNYRVFMGIDISIGSRPVTFVALDADQQLQAIGEGEVADALAFAAGQNAGALVTTCAAARPNQGRMTRPDVRSTLVPSPPKGKWKALRQAEYELIQAGIDVPATPNSPERSLPWVQRGFALVERLEELGYQAFSTRTGEDDGSPVRHWLETNPDAAFWSLLGVVPLPSGTLEGRIQRQLALRDQGLKVPDAMDFFEEITRFKLMRSILPDENIFPQAELNAWVAAHTAWLAANQPDCTREFGETEEGIIYLPAKNG